MGFLPAVERPGIIAKLLVPYAGVVREFTEKWPKEPRLASVPDGTRWKVSGVNVPKTAVARIETFDTERGPHAFDRAILHRLRHLTRSHKKAGASKKAGKRPETGDATKNA